MKHKQKTIWILVRVYRGLIENAGVFCNRKRAMACECRWRAKLNPDYDELEIFRRNIRFG
jgi:hypothetical protein